jgi:hypothetical protein
MSGIPGGIIGHIAFDPNNPATMDEVLGMPRNSAP